MVRRFITGEQGQGLIEYALIIGLIAVVAIAALTASGGSLNGAFTKTTTQPSAVKPCIWENSWCFTPIR